MEPVFYEAFQFNLMTEEFKHYTSEFRINMTTSSSEIYSATYIDLPASLVQHSKGRRMSPLRYDRTDGN